MLSSLVLVSALCTAPAADLYVNGVLANGLRDQEFETVDVIVDGTGDIYIDAPRYDVQVLEPGVPTTESPAQSPPTSATTPTSASKTTSGTSEQKDAVAPGNWWLISEDNASSGHVVEVRINGVIVRTIRSGDPQIIVDLASWLQPGVNTVTMRARPSTALGGGVLHLYIGQGSNEQGVVRMDDPPIDFARRSTDDPSGLTKTYTLTIR